MTSPVSTLPPPIAPVQVRARSLVSAAGRGCAALAQALRLNRRALQPNTFTTAPLDTWIGRVEGIDGAQGMEGAATGVLPAALQHWDCRANRLAWMGLQADGFAEQVQGLRAACGPARIGLVLGTSASTIGVSEQAYRALHALQAAGGFPPALRSPRLNQLHAVTAFVQAALQIEGPAATVSTACSSSAKAFAQAERWLRLDLCDAVVVGGVDSLCHSVLFGFAALGLVDVAPCAPFAATRRGISVGEAAGFALLTRGHEGLLLIGHGESNDAHHMSSPHPEALGAELALDAALARAGCSAEAVDYLNLHGTATPLNDAVESRLVARRYRTDVHASATKGHTGHTMGAAGLVEALICLEALDSGLCAGTAGLAEAAGADPALGPRFAAQLHAAPVPRPAGSVRVAASHSFGFGGNNAVLLFGKGPA